MSKIRLFQYYIVSAHMGGVAETGIALSDLPCYGNHRPDTFRRMSDEMVILDSIIYQMNPDGLIEVLNTAAGKEQSSPVAMITQFQSAVATFRRVGNKEDFESVLAGLSPKAKSHYLALHVDGVLKSVTVRTVGGQKFPGDSLSKLGKRQVCHTFEDIYGT